MKKIILGLILLIISLNTYAQIADSLKVRDTRQIINKPSNYKNIAKIEFKTNNSISLSDFTGYSGLFTIAPWVDDSGGPNHQLAFYKSGIYHRVGYTGNLGSGNINESNHKWLSWNKLIIGDINGVIQSKLDVNGTIRAKEVKIEATGWADFVFSPDYQLKPLWEVENHIKEHNHLPDIPSETEVKENGISVGEMQTKLLQKIEELTLYVIGQQKEIKELKEELINLKK